MDRYPPFFLAGIQVLGGGAFFLFVNIFTHGSFAIVPNISVIILIFSILTFGKMRFLKIEGGGQLLASSIIFTVFTFFGFLLGIVIAITIASIIKPDKFN